eukprot:TRINITY_DN35821_c0_g1_i1.p1 TRINITY_DN35821_c0_g1~~TRINITY_DN35821_c0_g1_i1.p1  ORF type:complete len:234 (+),score=37.69 TRINITY_DN35821_c0_g1_i1:51-752(+)
MRIAAALIAAACWPGRCMAARRVAATPEGDADVSEAAAASSLRGGRLAYDYGGRVASLDQGDGGRAASADLIQRGPVRTQGASCEGESLSAEQAEWCCLQHNVGCQRLLLVNKQRQAEAALASAAITGQHGQMRPQWRLPSAQETAAARSAASGEGGSNAVGFIAFGAAFLVLVAFVFRERGAPECLSFLSAAPMNARGSAAERSKSRTTSRNRDSENPWAAHGYQQQYVEVR